MTFSVPQPFISHHGKVSIPLEETTLFGRMIQHLARQWPEHDLVGYPYAISTGMWNSSGEDFRTEVLERMREYLFALVARDQLAIIGLSPVFVLPLDNQVPGPASLHRLPTVTVKDQLPVTAPQPIRMLYQQAHVVTPMTSENGAYTPGLTSRRSSG